MTYLIPDRTLGSRRDISLRGHYQDPHYHRQKVYAQPALCTEPHLLTSQLLNDPGFEIGSDIPQAAGIGFLPSSGTPIGWIQASGASEIWTIDTTDPRSGSQHCLWEYATLTWPLLWAFEQGTCEITNRYYSARIDPNDVLTFSVWGKMLPTNSAQLELRIQWYDSAYSVISTVDGPSVTIPSTYTQVSHSAVAPANTVYALTAVQVLNISGVDTIRLDDAVVSVA